MLGAPVAEAGPGGTREEENRVSGNGRSSTGSVSGRDSEHLCGMPLKVTCTGLTIHLLTRGPDDLAKSSVICKPAWRRFT